MFYNKEVTKLKGEKMKKINFKHAHGGGGTRVERFFTFKWPAFTLAEVLITLGIIGVVSSLTMPTLIASSRKSEYSARLKKYFSTMNQAIIIYNQDKNMLPEDWIVPDEDSLETFWNTHFAPYFKNIVYTGTEKSDFTSGKSGIVVKFGDGSSMSMVRGGAAVDILYDVNGDKAPNQWGRDIHKFILEKGNFSAYGWAADIGEGGLYDEDEDGNKFTTDMDDRDNVLRLCKRSGSYCSRLLQLDGWEFKDDYPYKI